MVYLTGDIHGSPRKILNFCEKENPTEEDVIIILGDAGLNFYMNERDKLVKQFLSYIKPTVFCVHGNHEARPATIPSYHLRDYRGGQVWVEEDYPSLLFAKDGDIYDFDGKRCIVLGGAYSTDRQIRLLRGYGWWPDEQPSDEIKAYAEEQLRTHKIDVVLSHTCPFRYEPIEMFMSGVDRADVDITTEEWLDKIAESTDYDAWYCGHWHTDKHIDKMHFLMHDFETL